MAMFPVLVIPEDTESSDGRSYPAGLLSWRDTIPLQFTDETTLGHEGAYHVGNITNLRRQTVDGATWIVGDVAYDQDEEATEAERLAIEGRIFGVSADVAEIWEDTGEVDEMGFPVFTRTAAEIVGATQLPMPAFAEARILTDQTALPQVVTASLRPEVSVDWFTDPALDGPTPLVVTEEGRIFGHLATWSTCHIGFPNGCVTPPEGTDYSYFHTGAVALDSEIPVGHITMGTGHASLSADAKRSIEHYDNTGSCVADVCVGEDEHGIWVAGAARPGIDIDALRSASLSGDWRTINGTLELVAALAVNVPGFPIPRTQAAVAASAQISLVASGIVEPEPAPDPLEMVRSELATLNARLDVLFPDEDDEPITGDVPPIGHIAAILELSNIKRVG